MNCSKCYVLLYQELSRFDKRIFMNMKFYKIIIGLASSGAQPFSDRAPFVGPVLLQRTWLFQENSSTVIVRSKVWKTRLDTKSHEQTGCEKS